MKGKELYTASLAERIKDGNVGKPYRPSNGTEGALFQDLFCQYCTRDNIEAGDGCEIILLTMCYDTKDKEYPKEWIYDVDGQPVCTAVDWIDQQS